MRSLGYEAIERGGRNHVSKMPSKHCKPTHPDKVGHRPPQSFLRLTQVNRELLRTRHLNLYSKRTVSRSTYNNISFLSKMLYGLYSFTDIKSMTLKGRPHLHFKMNKTGDREKKFRIQSCTAGRTSTQFYNDI